MAVDPQHMALAESIARMGSAGIHQQQAAQQTSAAPKQQALNDVSARAGLVSAPQAFLQQAAAKTAVPFDNAATSASNNKAALDSYMGALQGANGNYMSQLHAAIPLAQAEVDKAANAQNLGQMLQLLNLQNAQEDRNYTNTIHQQALTKSQDDLGNQAASREALTQIMQDPNKSVSQAALNLISSSQDATGALAHLSSPDGQKELKKLGINDDSQIRQYVLKYFDPQTAAAVAAAQAQVKANTPAPAAAKPSGPKKSPLDKLNANLPGWFQLGGKF